MIAITGKKIFYFVLTITVLFVMLICFCNYNENNTNNKLLPSNNEPNLPKKTKSNEINDNQTCQHCDDDFECWLQKKEKLNLNIAEVCRKYRDVLMLPGTVLTKMRRFLHLDKMINCLNEKVN